MENGNSKLDGYDHGEVLGGYERENMIKLY